MTAIVEYTAFKVTDAIAPIMFISEGRAAL